MLRCPTCVTVVSDETAKRCIVCGENFKRKPPVVLGAERRGYDKLTSWDLAATRDATRQHALDLIDLTTEHDRDNSGRVAAVDKR